MIRKEAYHQRAGEEKDEKVKVQKEEGCNPGVREDEPGTGDDEATKEILLQDVESYESMVEKENIFSLIEDEVSAGVEKMSRNEVSEIVGL